MIQLFAPNGNQIVGTLEALTGRANAVFYEADGSPIHDGETTVFWDGQETVLRDGLTVYLCEDGDEWTLDQLCIHSVEDLDPAELIGRRVVYLHEGSVHEFRGRAGKVTGLERNGWLVVDVEGQGEHRCTQAFLRMAARQYTTAVRMGDFYEFFGDDADAIAKHLKIVATTARDGRRCVGIPVHRWEIDRKSLWSAGFVIRVERNA